MSLYCFVGGSTVVGDPHFMITDPRSKEHFCFDYGGYEGETLVLVDDGESGKDVESHMINVSIVIPALFLIIGTIAVFIKSAGK